MQGYFNRLLKGEKKINIAIIAVYFILVAGVFLVNVFDVVFDIDIIDINIELLNDITVPIQITLMLYLIVAYQKKGYKFSFLMGIINLIALVTPCVFFGEMRNSTTIIMQVLAIALNTVVYSFVMKLEKKEKELFKVAYIDPLTNLPNRTAFSENLKKAIAKNNKFAVVLMDLDNFKTINDVLGRELGDKVLNELVARWHFAMEEKDILARIEGDQFAILIENYESKQRLVQHIYEFEGCVKRKISIASAEFFMTASFGVSLFPQDAQEPEALLSCADLALFTAQDEYKSDLVFFDGSMLENIENDRKLESTVRENLTKGSFDLVFQPQFDAENKKLRGFETLLRMKDNNGVPVSPGRFIPVAEKNGSIIDIDRFVLNKAMETFKDIVNSKGNENLLISVNISAIHLLEADLIGDVVYALEKNNFPPHNLELEITESVFITSIAKAVDVLNKLKNMGIQIALDDFGTGYASLSYLKKLPIDLLKIDKSFIDEIEHGDKESDFVAAIISMGHLLKFSVISEGVEDEAQLNILKKLNCDYIQGYLWGKPMDISKAKELIKDCV